MQLTHKFKIQYFSQNTVSQKVSHNHVIDQRLVYQFFYYNIRIINKIDIEYQKLVLDDDIIDGKSWWNDSRPVVQQKHQDV